MMPAVPHPQAFLQQMPKGLRLFPLFLFFLCEAGFVLQGAFLDSEAANKSSSNLSADELLELLNTDKTFQDKAQSGVVTDKVHALQMYCKCLTDCAITSLHGWGTLNCHLSTCHLYAQAAQQLEHLAEA